jgi:hypothetical protein
METTTTSATSPKRSASILICVPAAKAPPCTKNMTGRSAFWDRSVSVGSRGVYTAKCRQSSATDKDTSSQDSAISPIVRPSRATPRNFSSVSIIIPARKSML